MQRPRAESSEERIDEAIDACGDFAIFTVKLIYSSCIYLLGQCSYRNYDSDDEL